jgi:hypothetical protein
MERQVVLGVPRRVDRRQGTASADIDLFAIVQSSHAGGVGRLQPAVKRIKRSAVDSRSRRDEASRVSEVARTSWVDQDGCLGERFSDVADTACVVQVDVGNHDRSEVQGA